MRTAAVLSPLRRRGLSDFGADEMRPFVPSGMSRSVDEYVSTGSG